MAEADTIDAQFLGGQFAAYLRRWHCPAGMRREYQSAIRMSMAFAATEVHEDAPADLAMLQVICRRWGLPDPAHRSREVPADLFEAWRHYEEWKTKQGALADTLLICTCCS